MFFLLGCESQASFPVTHPGQVPGRLFPLAKGNPSVFSTGCVTSLGFQQAHKQQFPKYCDKNHEQTESQANGRSWASRLRYSEPQIISPMDMSTGWSTLLCCSLHPRDSVSPDGDSHCWEFFPSTVLTVWFWFCPMRCSVSNRNLIYAVTELPLCLDTEQPLPPVRHIFPTQRR